jgi:hypothetical protein
LHQSLRDRETELIDTTRNDLVRSTLLHYLDCWRNVEMPQGDAQQGWLYILSTRAQPDILKIGMTIRTVPERVKEISSATGVLYPFSARVVYKGKDARAAERRVFQLLSEYRVRQDREFFEIPFPTEVPHEDIKSLEQGQRVEFDLKHSSKGIAATRVVVVYLITG